jgi:hypothetical protein
MRRLLLVAVLGMSCHGIPTYDVHIQWTFGGQSCVAAGVSTVQIQLLGYQLAQTTYNCADVVNGVDLGPFGPGNFAIAFAGFDAAGNLIFLNQTVITVVMKKNNAPEVFALNAVAQTGFIDLFWTFGGQTCAAAGVSTVTVDLDGTRVTDANGSTQLPCTAQGIDGASVGPLLSGSHTFAVFGQGSTQSFGGSTTFAATAGIEQGDTIDLPAVPQPASAQVSWTFGGTHSCADIQADHVQVVLSGPQGAVMAGQLPCQTNGVVATGMTIQDIPNGTATVNVNGIRQRTTIYSGSAQATFAAPNATQVQVDAEPTH